METLIVNPEAHFRFRSEILEGIMTDIYSAWLHENWDLLHDALDRWVEYDREYMQ